MTKQKNTKRKRYLKSAAKCWSGGVRDALASKWTPKKQARHEGRKLGTFGPASEVVRINPETMEPYE